MPVYTSEGIAFHTDIAGTLSTIGSGFNIEGSSGHADMVGRSNNTANLGTTGVTIPTGADTHVLKMSSPSGYCVLNDGLQIPVGAEVQIDFWSCTPAGDFSGSGVGLTTLSREENRNDDEYLFLQEATNNTFSTGTAEIGVKWKRSTTNLDTASYTDLSVNGRIRGDEFPTYAANSTITLNAYRINFTSTGRYYRLANSGTHNAGALDTVFLHDMKVMVTPAQVATSTQNNDVIVNRSPYFSSGHVSVLVTSDNMDASTSSFNVWASDAQGGGTAILSIAGGIKFDASEGKFTVGSSGLYKIDAVAYCHGLSVGGALNQIIKKNGSTDMITTTNTINASGLNHSSYIASGIIYLTSGDYIEHIADSAGPGSSQMRLHHGTTFTIRKIS